MGGTKMRKQRREVRIQGSSDAPDTDGRIAIPCQTASIFSVDAAGSHDIGCHGNRLFHEARFQRLKLMQVSESDLAIRLTDLEYRYHLHYCRSWLNRFLKKFFSCSSPSLRCHRFGPNIF